MRRRLVSFVLASAVFALPLAAQQHAEHPWLVRVRGLAIAPNASSSPAGLDVKTAATVEVDISRRISSLLSVELIAATAAHDVSAGGTSLGSVTHLPPTLLLQFTPVKTGAVHPYIGAGGNVTFFYNKTGGLEAFKLTTSAGWAVQGGIDFNIGGKNGRGVFNLDAKYIDIATNVKSGGTTAYRLKINPLVIGAGFGYRL